MDRVVLKKGRDKAVKKRHPWIFSGAIEKMPSCEAGTIMPVYSNEGEFLAQGYFNEGHSLAGRLFAWEAGEPKALLRFLIEKAYSLRASLAQLSHTDSYRLINAEGDQVPGLVIDRYGDYLVIQLHTSGTDRLRSFFIETLCELLSPKGIYEKSTSPARLEEGLEPVDKVIYGEVPESISIRENGLEFLVSPSLGQKTGFFLDQRQMRKSVQALSKNRRVLSLFSYTGGFGLFALKGGAKSATSVDISESACTFARSNSAINLLDSHEVVCRDAFDFLNEEAIDHDLVLLDPPAFAKKKQHLSKALQGYESLNRLAFSKMKPGSLLMTSSCSHHVNSEEFERAVLHGALGANRFVQIIGRHLQAADHPIALTHPEGHYLKSLLLFVQ